MLIQFSDKSFLPIIIFARFKSMKVEDKVLNAKNTSRMKISSVITYLLIGEQVGLLWEKKLNYWFTFPLMEQQWFYFCIRYLCGIPKKRFCIKINMLKMLIYTVNNKRVGTVFVITFKQWTCKTIWNNLWNKMKMASIKFHLQSFTCPSISCTISIISIHKLPSF